LQAASDYVTGDYFLEIRRRLRENREISGEGILRKLLKLPTSLTGEVPDWINFYTGFGRNKGRRLCDVNYYECMSDSMTLLIDKLFSDQEFLNALSGSSRTSLVK
jgi:hypothetical protein